MATTTTSLPLCVYCGTARPADQSACPACSRPWIDVRVGAEPIDIGAAIGPSTLTADTEEANGAVASGPVDTAEIPIVAAEAPFDADEHGDWDPPPKKRRDWSMWAIPALLAVAVIAVYALIFFGAFDGSNDSATTTPTTIAIAAPATPETTVPPTTEAPATTTTTTEPPTTTTTIPGPETLIASGDAVSPSRLTLRAAGVGPIEFETPAPEALGTLITSLGEADETGSDGIEPWLCPGAEGMWVRFAELTAIFAGDFETGTFVGYSFAEPSGPVTAHIDLTTHSGIRVGDSIADLEATYSQFVITYDVIDGETHFQLFEGEDLLLWGPVSSIDSGGRVLGIYSPPLCTTP